LCLQPLTPGDTEPQVAGLFKALASSFESSFARITAGDEWIAAANIKSNHTLGEDLGNFDQPGVG
jgi:hypothetical protein